MKHNRHSWLDGLRGLACLIVLSSHYVVAFFPAIYSAVSTETHSVWEIYIYNSLFKVFCSGEFGVCVFLIITGFLVGKKFLHTNCLQSVITYPIDRYLRLILPILVGNLFAYGWLKLNGTFHQAAGAITHSTWWLQTAWTFTPNIFAALHQAFVLVFFTNMNYVNMYNPILWPMPLFYIGSISVAILSYLVKNMSNNFRVVCYIICILLSIKTLFYPLIVGLLIADIYFNKKSMFDKYGIIQQILFFSIFIYFGSYPTIHTNVDLRHTIFSIIPTQLPIINNVSYLYHTLAATSLFILILSSKKWQKLLSQKFFRFFGSISYSLFIFSVISIYSVSSYLLIKLSFYYQYNEAVIITIIGSLSVLTLCSALFTKYLEIPIGNYLQTKSEAVYLSISKYIFPNSKT